MAIFPFRGHPGRWPSLALRGFVCKQCGKTAPMTGTNQKYCVECSAERARARGLKWSVAHPASPEKYKIYTARKKSRMTLAGIEINQAVRSGISDVVRPLEFAWIVRIAIPFSWAASKNRVYNPRFHHISLRQEVKEYRAGIVASIRAALRDQQVVQNRVWLTFFVQKTKQQGDAINVVDTVCDALVDAIGIDDRWFCIHRLDWEIVKQDPKIFIGIAQEDVPPVQACSSCGRLLPFDCFNKHKGTGVHGLARNCQDCRKASRRRNISGQSQEDVTQEVRRAVSD